MIADLLPTRLHWEGGKGSARLNGHEVALHAPPSLPGVDLVAIDYAPGEVAIVLPRFEGWREMRADEIEAARAFLRKHAGTGVA